MFGRKKISAIIAEFLGTFVLSTVVLTLFTRTSFPFFAAAAAGATLAAMVLIIGAASGSHINPAVTLGLWSLRKIQTAQALVYIIAQTLGGFVALRVNEQLIGEPLQLLAAAGVDWKILIAEALGAFVFVFAVSAAVYQGYQGSQLAATVGLALMVGILVASIASNGLINPALAIGVNSLSWAYVAGPLAGGVLGANTYALLYAPIPAKKKTKKRR